MPNFIAAKWDSLKQVKFFKQKNIFYCHGILSMLFAFFLFKLSMSLSTESE